MALTQGECCRDPIGRIQALVGAPLDRGFAKRWLAEIGEARRAAIELAFRAKGVYLVLDGGGGGVTRPGRVLIDGRAPTDREAGADVGSGGTLAVDSPRLYRLLELPRTTDGRIRIELAPGTYQMWTFARIGVAAPQR